jgi:anti-sigma B factor antagonist
MQLRSHLAGSINILELSGRFDNYTAPAVVEWLEKVAGTTPAQAVVNLTNVNFIDSTALATLVQGMRRCQERHGNLHLCGLQQQVYMIFELTRLNKAFPIFASESQAIEAFSN